MAENVSSADFEYEVGANPTGSSFYISRTGQETLHAADEGEFMFLFEKDMGIELQLHRKDLYFVHSAVLEIGDKALMIVAPSGTGKSTTSWALLHHGFRYLSDELAPINLDSMTVLPFPHALNLKKEPPAPYVLPETTIRTTATLHVPVNSLPAETADGPANLAAIFFS